VGIVFTSELFLVYEPSLVKKLRIPYAVLTIIYEKLSWALASCDTSGTRFRLWVFQRVLRKRGAGCGVQQGRRCQCKEWKSHSRLLHLTIFFTRDRGDSPSPENSSGQFNSLVNVNTGESVL
jgi:hypothetical protein